MGNGIVAEVIYRRSSYIFKIWQITRKGNSLYYPLSTILLFETEWKSFENLNIVYRHKYCPKKMHLYLTIYNIPAEVCWSNIWCIPAKA